MKNKNTFISGIALVILGSIFIATQRLDINGFLVLPAIGIGLIAWSIVGRLKNLMIPGGILLGIGLGSFLTDSSWAVSLGEDVGNSSFFLGFAAGWFSITILTFLAFDDFKWWPLIPGAIMTLLGSTVFGNAPLENGQWISWFNSPGSLLAMIAIIVGISIVWKEFTESVEDISSSLK